MQYLLQIFVSPDDPSTSLSADEQQAISQEYYAIRDMPGIVGGAHLQPIETATTVRVENGRALTTDGPFIESREVLGGYYLFEADDLDAAIAIAARIPAARFGGAVEVRPLVEQ
ncbi:MAG: YciI family protein [Gaiellales bacterium]